MLHEIYKLESTIGSSEGKSAKSTKTGKQKMTIPQLLVELKQEKFFNQPKFTKEIVNRLAMDGHHYPSRSLTYALQQSVRSRTLGRVEKNGKWAYVSR